MENKKCSKCGEILPLTEFYSSGNGKLRAECKKCHNNYVKGKYHERKDTIRKMKSQLGCAKCGDKREYVLDYHHIDPLIKENTVARMTSNLNKIEDIKKEIDKCIVLCANCHREFHYLNNNKNISIDEYLLGN